MLERGGIGRILARPTNDDHIALISLIHAFVSSAVIMAKNPHSS